MHRHRTPQHNRPRRLHLAFGSLSGLVPALLVPLAIFALVGHKMTADRLLAIEQAERRKDMTSVLRALDLQRTALLKDAVDYAVWDEMHDCVLRRDQAWFAKNVTDWVPEHFGVDLVVLADPRGRTIFQCGSLPWGERELAQLPFARRCLSGRTVSGLVRAQGRVMLIAGSPVLHSDGSGPQAGIYLYGRWLGDGFAAQMKRLSGVDVLIYRGPHLIAGSDPRAAPEPGCTLPTLAQFRPGEERFAFCHQGRSILTIRPLQDVAGQRIALLATLTPRGAILSSLRDLRYRTLALVGVSLLLGAVLLLVARARANITTSLRRITDTAWQIARGGELSLVADPQTLREVAALSEALGAMTAAWAETKDALRSQTLMDGLTGLYNHRHLQDRLAEEISRACRSSRPFCLAMVDIDHFKRINDTFGHPVGDQVLRELAVIVRQSFREGDVVGRYGGEEFMAILPETDLDQAAQAAERLRQTVEGHTFRAVRPRGPDNVCDEIETRLTVSVGLAAFPIHSTERDGLIIAADLALLMAKHLSRNAVRSYDQVPGSRAGDEPCHLHRFLSDPSLSTIEALAAAVDAKDHLTRGHSETVTRYAVALAQEIGLDEAAVETVRTAGLLHDVGKIGIPDALLHREGPLSSADRRVMESHVSIGAAIVGKAPLLAGVVSGVLYHHERYDGQGYPDGLKGAHIPLLARILAVADAFEAMTARRRYRPALSPQEALAEVRAGAGTQFDPALAEAFQRVVPAAPPEAPLRPREPVAAPAAEGADSAAPDAG